MHKKIIIFLLIIISLFSSNLIAKAKLIVRVTDYPPFYYQNEKGEWTGIGFLVAKEVIENAGYEFRVWEIPWKRALQYMKTGEIDIMLALSKTPEREEYINFIGHYRSEEMNLIVLEKNLDLPIENLDDLTKFDKKFGVQDNTYYKNLTERLNNDPKFAASFEYVYDHNLNLRKTRHERLLGFFEEKKYAEYKIKNKEEYHGLGLHAFSLGETGVVYMGASKKLSEKNTRAIKNSFEELQKNGTIEKIVNNFKY